jgi:hypothetical protein
MSPQSRAANSADTLSESPEDLKETLASVGVHLKPSQLKTDAKELLFAFSSTPLRVNFRLLGL